MKIVLWIILVLLALRPTEAADNGVELHGFMQNTITLYEDYSGPVFGFDRVRIRTKGPLNDWVKYDLHLDFNRLIKGAGADQTDKDGDSPALIKDARLDFKLPSQGTFSVGKFKTPIGREFNKPGFKLDFVKRGFSHQALVFERNLGAMWQSRKMGKAKWQVRAGLFNPGPNKANETGNPEEGADLSFAGWLKGSPVKGVTCWLYGGGVSTSDTTTAGLDQEAISIYGASAALAKGPIGLALEYISRDDPDHSSNDGTSMIAQGTWKLTPWLQGGLKYETLDVENDAKDRADITLGLNFFFPPAKTWESKIMVNYVSSDLDGKSALQLLFQGYF